ncbi:MAG: hypothetical protein C1943_05265 [Halochromatium sp.]|nr:hypothetical protein [Halochromatium sp.]
MTRDSTIAGLGNGQRIGLNGTATGALDCADVDDLVEDARIAGAALVVVGTKGDEAVVAGV